MHDAGRPHAAVEIGLPDHGVVQHLLVEHLAAQFPGLTPHRGVLRVERRAQLSRGLGRGHRRRQRRWLRGAGSGCAGFATASPLAAARPLALGLGLLALDQLRKALGQAEDGIAATLVLALDEERGARIVGGEPVLDDGMRQLQQPAFAGLGVHLEISAQAPISSLNSGIR